MIGRPRNHRQHVVRPVRWLHPASEHVSETDNLRLVIGIDREPGRIEHDRAIGMQPTHAHREQLEHFPGEVLIRNRSRRGIRLLAVQHVKVPPHRWIERHLLQQSPEIPQPMPVEKIVVMRQSPRLLVQFAFLGDNKHLTERKGDAVPQLIGCRAAEFPPRPPDFRGILQRCTDGTDR